MNKLYVAIVFALFVVFGCGSEKSPAGLGDVDKTGMIVLNIIWPDGVIGKKTDVLRELPGKISAYLYRSGKEITRTDLKHEGSRGTAELTVAALSGYQLEIVAFGELLECILYTGVKDNISVSKDVVTTVDITMYDAAPIVNPAQKTGDTSYIISWSRVPLAISYLLEESTSSKFITGDFFDDTKLSSTVYAGSDTTKTFTDKESGTFYYAVFAMTQYGRTYTSSPAGEENWDFYILVDDGPMSNIISVQSGATGTMKIDIVWPTK